LVFGFYLDLSGSMRTNLAARRVGAYEGKIIQRCRLCIKNYVTLVKVYQK
jgi:hypothetical protein